MTVLVAEVVPSELTVTPITVDETPPCTEGIEGIASAAAPPTPINAAVPAAWGLGRFPLNALWTPPWAFAGKFGRGAGAAANLLAEWKVVHRIADSMVQYGEQARRAEVVLVHKVSRAVLIFRDELTIQIDVAYRENSGRCPYFPGHVPS